MQQTVVRYDSLSPDTTYVVFAARDERIGHGAAWHETTRLPPRQASYGARMVQIHEAVLGRALVFVER